MNRSRRPHSFSTKSLLELAPAPSGLKNVRFRLLVRLIEFVPLPETARTRSIESATGWVGEW
jgi:hypothetical protein